VDCDNQASVFVYMQMAPSIYMDSQVELSIGRKFMRNAEPVLVVSPV
jgi:hypothetical protein